MFDESDFEFTHSEDFYGNNPYYSPEKCGLSIVAQIELTNKSYQFDTRVVWKHENGNLYTARDSGCSCPTPFEDYRNLGDLTLLDKSTLENVKAELRTAECVSASDAQEFLYKIRKVAL